MSKAFLRLLVAAITLAAFPTILVADLQISEPAVTIIAESSKAELSIPSSFSDRWRKAGQDAYAYAPANVSPVEVQADVEPCADELACANRDLWVFYQRSHKVDKTGDFAWKDIKAAERSHRTLEDQVIRGMDPSFRMLAASALRKLEAAGFSPCVTSAFRDDYRQSLIHAGMHALVGHSFHGGDGTVRGYGHGVAIDLVSCNGTTSDEHYDASEELWKYIDAHVTELGIARPYGAKDPSHMAPAEGAEYGIRRLVAERRILYASQACVPKVIQVAHRPEHFGKKQHAHPV